jgi:uncharacterized repeat protein (TIGR04076 family)
MERRLPKMNADENIVAAFQHILGYTDEEFERWKAVPRNIRLAGCLPEIAKYRMVVEVVRSHGCVMGHKPGDKFYFAGNGALLCSEGPSHICAGALAPLMAHAWKIVDKVGVGQDPVENTFNRVGCIDVGLEGGGWGNILMEIRVEKSE